MLERELAEIEKRLSALVLAQTQIADNGEPIASALLRVARQCRVRGASIRSRRMDVEKQLESSDFDEVCSVIYDGSLLHHGFADHSRDYEALVDLYPAQAEERRLLTFQKCVVANVESGLRPDTWQVSLDDRNLNWEQWNDSDLTGYVWGVKYECLEPGGRVVTGSPFGPRSDESCRSRSSKNEVLTRTASRSVNWPDWTFRQRCVLRQYGEPFRRGAVAHRRGLGQCWPWILPNAQPETCAPTRRPSRSSCPYVQRSPTL